MAMAKHLKDRKKLSKHLLEMKFMKFSRDRIEKEEEEESCKEMFYGHISDELKSSSSKFITEPSWVICEGLKCGRRSYKGMNPAIEKILALENEDKNLVQKVKEEDVDVTAEEMAEIYRQESTLIETVAKKFKNTKSDSLPPSKRMKFLKPSED